MTTTTATEILIKSQIKPRIEPRLNIKEPRMFKVIYINDEVTTAEFVIESLVTIFNLEHSVAEELTQKIHEDGSAVVSIMPYEIAEQNGIEVSFLARRQGYPLEIKLEAEE